MSEVIIQPLHMTQHFADACGSWSMDAWRTYPINANNTLAQTQNRYREKAGAQHDNSFPFTWVASIDGKAAGMASLMPEEHDDFPELTPWLGIMYVAEEFRHRGIATSLINTVHDRAKQLGHKEIFLSTPDAMTLYKKSGYRTISNGINDPSGKLDSICLMRRDL